MKKLFGKIRKFSTISKRLLFLLILGNITFFFYHYVVIGMDPAMGGILQISAFITEFLLSSWHESLLAKSNRKANESTRKIQKNKWIFKSSIKTALFILCFLALYTIPYCLRLQFFGNIIHYGISPEELKNSTQIALMTSPLLGTFVGFSTIGKIKNKRLIFKHGKSSSE